MKKSKQCCRERENREQEQKGEASQCPNLRWTIIATLCRTNVGKLLTFESHSQVNKNTPTPPQTHSHSVGNTGVVA